MAWYMLCLTHTVCWDAASQNCWTDLWKWNWPLNTEFSPVWAGFLSDFAGKKTTHVLCLTIKHLLEFSLSLCYYCLSHQRYFLAVFFLPQLEVKIPYPTCPQRWLCAALQQLFFWAVSGNRHLLCEAWLTSINQYHETHADSGSQRLCGLCVFNG